MFAYSTFGNGWYTVTYDATHTGITDVLSVYKDKPTTINGENEFGTFFHVTNEQQFEKMCEFACSQEAEGYKASLVFWGDGDVPFDDGEPYYGYSEYAF